MYGSIEDTSSPYMNIFQEETVIVLTLIASLLQTIGSLFIARLLIVQCFSTVGGFELHTLFYFKLRHALYNEITYSARKTVS